MNIKRIFAVLLALALALSLASCKVKCEGHVDADDDYKCDKCGYVLNFKQGIGYLYPLEADKMLNEIQQGKFGKRFMEAANKVTAPKVEFSHELYRCGKCGELRPDLKIALYDGDKLIMSKRQVCGKCR